MEKQKNNVKITGLSAAETAKLLERLQISKYHTKGGHGFAAEDVNAFHDKVRLKKVEITGLSNEVNGPDRIVNGVKIQTKYCQTARETINAAFDSSGMFRYNGQLIEVPSDQYDECVKIMREKILAGKVPGVTDPADAEKIVKKGSITYKQARNIAKAGNIDSIIFDTKTQAITSGYIFAISFAVSFAKARWDGNDNDDAIEAALQSAFSAGITTFVTGVVTAQILRTRAAAVGAVAMRSGVKTVYKTSLGKAAIEKLAQASLGKAVYGAAAMNHVAKLLRSNVITSVAATAVTAAPDFYRAALDGSISWKQFSKNLFVNAASVAGGVGGWMAGATGGAAIGSFIPIIGTTVGGVIGGIVGGLTGGTGAASVAKAVADEFAKDDAEEMIEILKDVTEELAYDYMLSEKEINEFSEKFKSVVEPSWLREMYKYGNGSYSLCREFAYKKMSRICESIVRKRPKIYLPKPEEVQSHIDIFIQKAGLIEEAI